MKKLLRVLGWILGVLGVAWLGVCAWLSATHPRVSFTAAELALPPVPLPKGFLWGTATSSHQLEGGHANDWTRFEAQPGTIERAETSAVSADHWNRMAEDVALMKAIRTPTASRSSGAGSSRGRAPGTRRPGRATPASSGSCGRRGSPRR